MSVATAHSGAKSAEVIASAKLLPSRATRLLCAAAYTDKQFRDKAITIHEDEYRAKAPELGIDAGAVLQHCYTARRRAAWRNGILCIPVLLLLSTGIVRDLAAFPDEVPLVLQAYAGSLLLAWLACGVVMFGETFANRYLTFVHDLSPNQFGQVYDVVPPRPLSDNVTVYGAFSPFSGSGFDIGGWSFSVNIKRPRSGSEDEPPEPFAIHELYDEIRQGFADLSIQGLLIQDRLFVDGRAIRGDRRFLPSPYALPTVSIDSDLMEAFQAEPTKTARHYLCLELADWSGELVLSTFIRFQKSESNLFVETSNFLLPPLKRAYDAADKISFTPLLKVIGPFLVRSALLGPLLAIAAPFSTIALLFTPLEQFNRVRRLRRAIREDPGYNYGALQSIRELGTENSWRVYFQKLDKEMHSKVVQQRLIDGLIDFLDDRGIDTSEIKDRGSHILNNGIMVSGGAISAESLAVGDGARANTRKGKGRAAKNTA